MRPLNQSVNASVIESSRPTRNKVSIHANQRRRLFVGHPQDQGLCGFHAHKAALIRGRFRCRFQLLKRAVLRIRYCSVDETPTNKNTFEQKVQGKNTPISRFIPRTVIASTSGRFRRASNVERNVSIPGCSIRLQPIEAISSLPSKN